MAHRKTVLTYGTFDLFHYGHLRLLERAKDLGDDLIVGVSTDEFHRFKKKHEAVIPFEQRLKIVESLYCVDTVIHERSWEQKLRDINDLGVDVLVMGDDWAGQFDEFKPYCEVVYLPRTHGVSTSLIKEAIRREI